MECLPLLSNPFLSLFPLPTGVKVGYSMSRFCSGMVSVESMLELDADINDSRNALNEDVSGPLGISPSSSSYIFSCPSVAS
jgi:hypothetical protein